jgi:hypothetical protein
MENEQLVQKIKLQAKDGKIACKHALKLAEEEIITPKALGKILNELNIKVMSCQLGCFP